MKHRNKKRDNSASDVKGACVIRRREVLPPDRLAQIQSLKTVAKIVRQQFDESIPDLLEDDYAVLLTSGDKPVSAATLTLHGSDHARLEMLVTRQASCSVLDFLPHGALCKKPSDRQHSNTLSLS